MSLQLILGVRGVEGNINLAQRWSRNPVSDPTVPTFCAPDNSHDGDRNFQELPPSSSNWLANPCRPGSMPQLASAQPQATAPEGK